MLKSAHVYKLSRVVQVLEFGFIYLFFNERGADCVPSTKFWNIRNGRVWITWRSVCEWCERGSTRQISVASNGQNCIRAGWPVQSFCLSFHKGQSFLSWGGKNTNIWASYFCPVLPIVFALSKSSTVFPPPLCVPACFPFHSFLSLSYLLLLVFLLKEWKKRGSRPMERHKGVGRGKVTR